MLEGDGVESRTGGPPGDWGLTRTEKSVRNELCTEIMPGSPCLEPMLKDYTQQSANGH